MIKKDNSDIFCYFEEDGSTIQEVVEKYFIVYFSEELMKTREQQ